MVTGSLEMLTAWVWVDLPMFLDRIAAQEYCQECCQKGDSQYDCANANAYFHMRDIIANTPVSKSSHSSRSFLAPYVNRVKNMSMHVFKVQSSTVYTSHPNS